jgi:hypothetical protein
MQPESSDGFASVGTILPKEKAALLPGGFFASSGAFAGLGDICNADIRFSVPALTSQFHRSAQTSVGDLFAVMHEML